MRRVGVYRGYDDRRMARQRRSRDVPEDRFICFARFQLSESLYVEERLILQLTHQSNLVLGLALVTTRKSLNSTSYDMPLSSLECSCLDLNHSIPFLSPLHQWGWDPIFDSQGVFVVMCEDDHSRSRTPAAQRPEQRHARHELCELRDGERGRGLADVVVRHVDDLLW